MQSCSVIRNFAFVDMDTAHFLFVSRLYIRFVYVVVILYQ